MLESSADESLETEDSERTSQSLLIRVQRNDAMAWERLVRLYSPLVYYWCQESGLPLADLHDVFQEVFHTLARNIRKFKPVKNGTFRGWLRTMTRNKVVDFYRKSGREPRPIGGTEALRKLEQLPCTEHAFSGQAEMEVSPREMELQNAMLRDALSNIRGSFADQTWKAFWMVVIDGRDTSDVASDLSMRPGTVRVAKSRVLKRLRLEIGDTIDSN